MRKFVLRLAKTETMRREMNNEVICSGQFQGIASAFAWITPIFEGCTSYIPTLQDGRFVHCLSCIPSRFPDALLKRLASR